MKQPSAGARRPRRPHSVTGLVAGLVLLTVAAIPAVTSDRLALATLLGACAAIAGATAIRARRPGARAAGIAAGFLGGGVLVRLVTGDADLAAVWFLAALGGAGVALSLVRTGNG